MKTRMKILTALLSIGLCFQSCNKDNLEEAVLEQSDLEEPVVEEVAKGSVSLDVFLKDPINIVTARALSLEEALDVMLVEITSTTGGTIFVSENYRDLPAAIELPEGNYNMLISNFPLSDVRFDDGVYGDYLENFEITTGANTVLTPVLTLLDVATTVNFSEDILAEYPDISAYVARSQLPANPFTEFPLELRYEVADNGRRGYHGLFRGSHIAGFTKYSGGLFINLSATGPAGEDIRVSREINGVSSNQHYNINVELTGPSTTSLDITLEPEEDNTETINFPN